jgi:hypothetical protein
LVLGRHFALTDADGRLLKRIPIPPPEERPGVSLVTIEARVRAEHGVDDVTLFLRDSALDQAP